MELPPKPALLKVNTDGETPEQLKGRIAAGKLPASLLAEAAQWIAECDGAAQHESIAAPQLAATAAKDSAKWTMIAAIFAAISTRHLRTVGCSVTVEAPHLAGRSSGEDATTIGPSRCRGCWCCS